MGVSRVLISSLLLAHGSWLGAAQCGGTNASATLIHVQGQSGKFTIYNAEDGRSNGIEINIDALRELDSSGNAVGTTGSVKHSIQTFAAQDFTIAPIEQVTLGTSPSVAADKISFNSAISSIGQIKIDTFIIKESGMLGPPGEMWNVSCGDVKWNIELSSWSWCGTGTNDVQCRQGQNDQVGDMIDVDITVKSMGTMEQGTSAKQLSLGGGATMELSDQVDVDGTWTAMPANFPSISIQGSQTTLTFRFPKFTTKAVYDPLVQLEQDQSSDEATTIAPGGGNSGDTTTIAPGDTVADAGCRGAPSLVLACLLVVLAKAAW